MLSTAATTTHFERESFELIRSDSGTDSKAQIARPYVKPLCLTWGEATRGWGPADSHRPQVKMGHTSAAAPPALPQRR